MLGGAAGNRHGVSPGSADGPRPGRLSQCGAAGSNSIRDTVTTATHPR
jgi:hypothetical protein